MKATALGGAALLIAAGLSTAVAACDRQRLQAAASIPFVSHGGIRDWRSTDDHTLYVEDRSGRWYVAKTLGPCLGLNTAINVAFDAGATDTFDRFSSILVRGQRCPIKSLNLISGPPPSSAPHAADHTA